ncbi:MAG: DNA N-6-adenine-methyltransferase [Gammaproteobacteria bacterium]|nr:DNA N-6-adenine-methyltransferase [Gammaproteobacteria bacterium]
MGSHQSAAALKDEWLTPPHIIAALGEFDLDPCSPINRPWPTAAAHYTILDNGLQMPWHGRVWCNPPYGLEAAQWLARCADHGNAIALVFARTETRMFFDHVWPEAHAVLFIEGRLHFHHVDGTRAKANSGAPSVLIAYGAINAADLRRIKIPGKFIRLKL